MRLADRVAVVTGGGSGIGKAIAQAYVDEGASVVISGRNHDKLKNAAAELGARCIPIVCDVADLESIVTLVKATVEKLHQVNILVNNAGVLLPGNAETLSEEAWEQTFNTNVRGVWQLSRAVLPRMRAAGGGSIINIASVLSTLGARNRVAYAASKGAVMAMTKAMALDHAAEDIRVNCICPGIVETEMVAAFGLDEAARKQRIAMHPAGRFGQPKDVAGMAVLLASDESKWITGSAFTVDGGYSAQ